jgi:TATA-binding protein-associated factor Taf7
MKEEEEDDDDRKEGEEEEEDEEEKKSLKQKTHNTTYGALEPGPALALARRVAVAAPVARHRAPGSRVAQQAQREGE